MIKEFEIRYRYGKEKIYLDTDARQFMNLKVSKSMISQILEKMNEKIKNIFGDYTWEIIGDSGKYMIVARYGSKFFTESTGKTPAESFWNCYQVRTALELD